MIHVNKGDAPDFKKDWAEAIKTKYNSKCAYCEQNQEAMQIDHYRPRAEYTWLIDSWENQLCSCPKCNCNKSDNFPIKGNKITASSKPADYDTIEEPLLVNPEKERCPENNFEFKKTGEIEGSTEKGIKTVDVCKLDRTYLNEKRKMIYDQVKYPILEALLFNDTTKIMVVVKQFIEDCKNQKTEFLAFHKFVLKNELKQMYG